MFCYHELNLFGDPALPIYGAKKKSYSDSKSSNDLHLVKSNLKINSFLLLKMFENLIQFLLRK